MKELDNLQTLEAFLRTNIQKPVTVTSEMLAAVRGATDLLSKLEITAIQGANALADSPIRRHKTAMLYHELLPKEATFGQEQTTT